MDPISSIKSLSSSNERAQVLFNATEYRGDFFHAAYDVSADGQRFVMIRTSESGSLNEELIVVETWFEELSRLAPTN